MPVSSIGYQKVSLYEINFYKSHDKSFCLKIDGMRQKSSTRRIHSRFSLMRMGQRALDFTCVHASRRSSRFSVLDFPFFILCLSPIYVSRHDRRRHTWCVCGCLQPCGAWLEIKNIFCIDADIYLSNCRLDLEIASKRTKKTCVRGSLLNDLVFCVCLRILWCVVGFRLLTRALQTTWYRVK